MSQYAVYYPRLVSQFFQHLQTDETKSKIWTEVQGVKIKLNELIIRKTLDLPAGDVDEWILDYDPYDAYTIMTDLPSNTADPKQIQLTSYNTNSFPPL